MNHSFALSAALVFGPALGIAACSSSDGESSPAATCSPALQSAVGCPDRPTAEGKWEKVQSTCGLTADDFDTSNASSPTLREASKAKACVSCDCRTAIYAYASAYHACTTDDQANAALASNLHQLAAACP